MKVSSKSAAAVMLLIVAGCCGSATAPAIVDPVSDNRPIPINPITIVRGFFVCPGGKSANVTDRMGNVCNGRSACDIEVTPWDRAIRADPHPGCTKRLDIDYHCGTTARPTVVLWESTNNRPSTWARIRC